MTYQELAEEWDIECECYHSCKRCRDICEEALDSLREAEEKLKTAEYKLDQMHRMLSYAEVIAHLPKPSI